MNPSRRVCSPTIASVCRSGLGVALALALVLPAVAQEADPGRTTAAPPAGVPRPPVSVEPTNIDLGFLPPKTIGRAKFTLTNTGSSPLTILDVSPTCRCTSVGDHIGKVLAPGVPYEFEIHLDAAIIPQARSAVVRVLFDGYQRTIDLAVRGEIANPVRTVPGWINAPDGSRPSGRLVVESIDEVPFRICSVHGLPPNFNDFDPAVDEPRARYVVNFDLAELPEGPLPGWLIVETDHPVFPVVDVRVRGNTSDFRVGIRGVRDIRVPMGRIKPGGSGETTVEFGGLSSDLTFTSAESLREVATVELIGQEGDRERLLVGVRVTPRDGHHGLLYLPIRLHAGAASQEVVLFATVQDSGCTPASASSKASRAAESGDR